MRGKRKSVAPDGKRKKAGQSHHPQVMAHPGHQIIASLQEILERSKATVEWTRFRLHTLGGSMTHEEVPWASFHGRPMDVACSPPNSSARRSSES